MSKNMIEKNIWTKMLFFIVTMVILVAAYSFLMAKIDERNARKAEEKRVAVITELLGTV